MTNKSNAELEELIDRLLKTIALPVYHRTYADANGQMRAVVRAIVEALERGLVPLPDEDALTEWLYAHAVGVASHDDLLARALAKKLIERFGTSALMPLPEKMPVDDEFVNALYRAIVMGTGPLWEIIYRRFGTPPAPSHDQVIVAVGNDMAARLDHNSAVACARIKYAAQPDELAEAWRSALTKRAVPSADERVVEAADKVEAMGRALGIKTATMAPSLWLDFLAACQDYADAKRAAQSTPQRAKRITCPECDGRGSVMEQVPGEPHLGSQEVGCPRCEDGTIPDRRKGNRRGDDMGLGSGGYVRRRQSAQSGAEGDANKGCPVVGCCAMTNDSYAGTPVCMQSYGGDAEAFKQSIRGCIHLIVSRAE